MWKKEREKDRTRERELVRTKDSHGQWQRPTSKNKGQQAAGPDQLLVASEEIEKERERERKERQ